MPVWAVAAVIVALAVGVALGFAVGSRGRTLIRHLDDTARAGSEAPLRAGSVPADRRADRRGTKQSGVEQGGVDWSGVERRVGDRRAEDRPDADGSRRRMSQPLASLVVEALDHGVVVVDREERAVLVNPAARGMRVLDGDTLIFPDLVTLVRRSLESGQNLTSSVDLPIGRLGREPIALSATVVPLRPDAGQRVAGVCLLLSDVSELRRLEAVRRDFVANVSHELKTPVGALTLLAEAIQDAADEPQMVARFAARIQHEGSRLAKLVGELMELSRVQGADPMPGATEVEVCHILDEAVERTRLAAEQASISVSVSCSPDIRVRGNRAQLGTAVANLVDNAIAYSGGGTKVAVTGRVSAEDPGIVDISVTDQGIGIAEADRDRIFERFYRIDPARSRATGGTGLGLAIVKNIVTNHLGSVSVWSADRSGSTFTIRLPNVHAGRSVSALDGPAGAHQAPSRSIGKVAAAPAAGRGSPSSTTSARLARRERA